jgi:hypothetical protein
MRSPWQRYMTVTRITLIARSVALLGRYFQERPIDFGGRRRAMPDSSRLTIAFRLARREYFGACHAQSQPYSNAGDYMNEMARFCEDAVDDAGGLARCDGRELNHELRRELHLSRQPPGYIVPIERAGGPRNRPPLRVVDWSHTSLCAPRAVDIQPDQDRALIDRMSRNTVGRITNAGRRARSSRSRSIA